MQRIVIEVTAYRYCRHRTSNGEDQKIHFLLSTGEIKKILVSVKLVVDYNVKIRVKSDQNGIEKANIIKFLNGLPLGRRPNG